MNNLKVGDEIVVKAGLTKRDTCGYYHSGMRGVVVRNDNLVSFDGGKTKEWIEGVCVFVDPMYAEVVGNTKQKEKKQLYKATEETLKLYKSGKTKVVLRDGLEATLHENGGTYPYYHDLGEIDGYHAVTASGISCIGMSERDVVSIYLKPSRVIKKLGEEAEMQLRLSTDSVEDDAASDSECGQTVALTDGEWGVLFDTLLYSRCPEVIIHKLEMQLVLD